ncbi:MAG: hypothetical protein LBV15_04615 [Planctomycetota bacterium]|nr:hypothetical protein [Planctomycetota bacterium]
MGMAKAALAALMFCFALSGCAGPAGPDIGRGQSLIEIGEQSLEQAEELERRGRAAEANILYRRALWAFGYHEQLTREQPFLMDEARTGASRTAGRP